MKKTGVLPAAFMIIAAAALLQCPAEINREKKLKDDVIRLTLKIGPRSPIDYDSLEKSAGYIRSRLEPLLPCRVQTYYVKNRPYRNIIFEKSGTGGSLPVIIMAAHYDSVHGTPGADDNASSVAVLLSVAESSSFRNKHPVRFVFFTLEEMPYYLTKDMGSMRYARFLRATDEKILLMISLEMVGFYSEERIQTYPTEETKSRYPAEANFVAVVGSPEHRNKATSFFKLLRRQNAFPVQLLVAPVSVKGIDFSDHVSFWTYGYPALMITDTAFYRNRNYHKATDRPDTLDYGKMSKLADSLTRVLKEIDAGH